MLDRCDRVQIAVHDVAEAFLRYKQLLGCDLYAGLFGLDPARFGDVGTLTLFDPPKPARPCRAQPRRGSCHGLLRQEARRFALYTPRGSDPVTDPDGGWVHPQGLHGLLLGISRTGLAWEWSGREDLVPPA